jgi:hypothetical protein
MSGHGATTARLTAEGVPERDARPSPHGSVGVDAPSEPDERHDGHQGEDHRKDDLPGRRHAGSDPHRQQDRRERRQHREDRDERPARIGEGDEHQEIANDEQDRDRTGRAGDLLLSRDQRGERRVHRRIEEKPSANQMT